MTVIVGLMFVDMFCRSCNLRWSLLCLFSELTELCLMFLYCVLSGLSDGTVMRCADGFRLLVIVTVNTVRWMKTMIRTSLHISCLPSVHSLGSCLITVCHCWPGMSNISMLWQFFYSSPLGAQLT